jgi:EAL domain-containing protein (putative c-di-GMP-specific phosphodiesterase class I)/GGDEF domain-containing protein
MADYGRRLMPHRQKILIFTQDSSFLEEFTQALDRAKYHLVSLPRLPDLMTSIYDQMPHLVICDIHRSDVASFDICGQMKQDIILGHIPLILITDSSRFGKELEGRADLYLQKPPEIKELVYHVARIIHQTVDELDINPLTHLPGNRSSVKMIEEILQEGEPFAVCCFDLKNLKAYNDVYGDHRGDFLIRETAHLIKEVVAGFASKKIFIGHLGGDDFIATTDSVTSVAISKEIIEKFDANVYRFYRKEDQERGFITVPGSGSGERHPFVNLSIAIVTNEKIQFKHLSEITRTASQIQRYLKRFPASTYLKDRRSDKREPVRPESEVSPVSNIKGMSPRKTKQNAGRQSETILEVMRFIGGDPIETHFQPLVFLRENKTFGYEALSRFIKSNGKFHDPARMFQAAREADVIKEFDVCCAKRALQNGRGLGKQYKLFLNLNRETIWDEKSMDAIFKDAGVPTGQIVIELTEQSLMAHTQRILESFKRLEQQGIELAIDDMGGGAVGLRETAELKPRYVKFDRSLIRDIHEQESKQKIMASLLVFAHGIHAQAVAEGIETSAEMQFLMNAGVDFGQGYFIQRPKKLIFSKAKHKEIP